MKFKSGKYYVVMEYTYDGNKLTKIKASKRNDCE